jgi:glycosyltransferase involved in cell wall biosynthesis
LTAIRDALAGQLGLAIHRAAGIARRIAPARGRDPRRLAVVCDSFLYWASSQAVALAQTGLSVTLYYVDRGSDFTGSEEDRSVLLDRARASGVQTVAVPRLRPTAVVKHALWLHRDLRRRKIATLVVHSHGDPRYATLALALPVALIVHDPQIHSGDTISMPPLPIRAISRVAETTASCVIVHSARLLDQLRPLLARLPIGVIPLGIDMAAAPAPVPSARRLLLFGRLFAYKGVDTALDAFGLLSQELPDVKLIVAGRGPLAARARGYANVEVREEYISDADVHVLLDESRLVLLPYKDATQSGVGLLAIARGVPVLVTRTGGLPELVPPSSPGLVVPPDDPQSLAAAIRESIDHDEDLRRAIHDHAAARFATGVAARRLRAELRRLGVLGEDLAVAGEEPMGARR